MHSVPDSDRDSRQSAPISVAHVRQLFSRPAHCTESQFIRREISGRMFERLSLIRARPERVLDAGCGEGDDLPALAKAFPEAELLGVDASPAMLHAARNRGLAAHSGMQRLLRRWFSGAAPASAARLACADFSALPLSAGSMNLLWSNLALHWHPQPHQVINEWARILRVEGLLMFSTIGPDTFMQLRDAYTAIGERPPVLPFVDLHDYGDMVVEAGFADPVMDMEKLNITYSSADKLLADVRAFGGNPLRERQAGLSSRHRLQALYRAIEAQKTADGLIPLTIEVIYGHAFRPLPKTTRSGEAIVHFRNKSS